MKDGNRGKNSWRTKMRERDRSENDEGLGFRLGGWGVGGC